MYIVDNKYQLKSSSPSERSRWQALQWYAVPPLPPAAGSADGCHVEGHNDETSRKLLRGYGTCAKRIRVGHNADLPVSAWRETK